MPRRKKTPTDQLNSEQLEEQLLSQVAAALPQHESVLDEERKILEALLVLGKSQRFFICNKEELAGLFKQAYDAGKLVPNGANAVHASSKQSSQYSQQPHEIKFTAWQKLSSQ